MFDPIFCHFDRFKLWVILMRNASPHPHPLLIDAPLSNATRTSSYSNLIFDFPVRMKRAISETSPQNGRRFLCIVVAWLSLSLWFSLFPSHSLLLSPARYLPNFVRFYFFCSLSRSPLPLLVISAAARGCTGDCGSPRTNEKIVHRLLVQ